MSSVNYHIITIIHFQPIVFSVLVLNICHCGMKNGVGQYKLQCLESSWYTKIIVGHSDRCKSVHFMVLSVHGDALPLFLC